MRALSEVIDGCVGLYYIMGWIYIDGVELSAGVYERAVGDFLHGLFHRICFILNYHIVYL